MRTSPTAPQGALPIALGQRAAVLDPPRKVPELGRQNGSLDVVEQRRETVVVVLPGLPILAVEPEQGDGAGDVRVVRRHRSAVPQRTEHLEGVKEL